MRAYRMLVAASRDVAASSAKLAPGFFSTKLRNPFFVIGCPRSGTTLLVDTMATHDAVAHFPGEANELWHPQLFPWRDSRHRDQVPPQEVDPREFTRLSLQHRTPAQVQHIRASFGAYQFFSHKPVFLNKSAMIGFMIPFIFDHFPEGKIVHIIRDGRSVALSWAKMQYKKVQDFPDAYHGHGFGVSFSDVLRYCAQSWVDHMEEVEKQKRSLELDQRGLILEIKYEEFCQDPKSILEEIADFMEISASAYLSSAYEHIASRDYKFNTELSEDVQRELTTIMRTQLEKWLYLEPQPNLLR